MARFSLVRVVHHRAGFEVSRDAEDATRLATARSALDWYTAERRAMHTHISSGGTAAPGCYAADAPFLRSCLNSVSMASLKHVLTFLMVCFGGLFLLRFVRISSGWLAYMVLKILEFFSCVTSVPVVGIFYLFSKNDVEKSWFFNISFMVWLIYCCSTNIMSKITFSRFLGSYKTALLSLILISKSFINLLYWMFP